MFNKELILNWELCEELFGNTGEDLTLEDGEMINIPNEMLPAHIEIQKPVDILEKINIKNANVEIIECVLDLEKLKVFVTEHTDTILSKIFDNNG